MEHIGARGTIQGVVTSHAAEIVATRSTRGGVSARRANISVELHRNRLPIHAHKAVVVVRQDRRQLLGAQRGAGHQIGEQLALITLAIDAAIQKLIEVVADLLQQHPLQRRRIGAISQQRRIHIDGGRAVGARGAVGPQAAIHGRPIEHLQLQAQVRTAEQLLLQGCCR